MADQRLRIQVAFQGGGAKIFALIAAAEVLKSFEREGRIEVTRIAGTSAGALVGTLYAAGVEPAVMRSELGSFPIRKLMTFRPATVEIDFILLSLSVSAKEEIGFVSCSVTDALDQKVPFEFFPVMDTGGPGLLVAFTPPLKKGAGNFRVRVRYKVRDSMPFLKKGERDEIALTIERADDVVDRMEFVLLVPDGFGKVRMEAPPETEPGVHPGGPWKLDEVARAMTTLEGFIPYGWAGDQVPASAVLKAYLLRDA